MHSRFPLSLRRSAAALFLALVPHAAWAVGTDPTLVLSSVDKVTAASGTVALNISGSFGFDDLVQFSFPFGVIVASGSSFARYPAQGAPVEGSDPAVADGVTADEIAHLLAVGSAASPPATWIELRSDRLSLALPGDLGGAPVTVVLYAIFEGTAFVSNQLTVTLP